MTNDDAIKLAEAVLAEGDDYKERGYGHHAQVIQPLQRTLDIARALLAMHGKLERYAAVVSAARAWAKFGRDDADDEHRLMRAVDALDGEGGEI